MNLTQPVSLETPSPGDYKNIWQKMAISLYELEKQDEEVYSVYDHLT